jgi:hypothetical protein
MRDHSISQDTDTTRQNDQSGKSEHSSSKNSRNNSRDKEEMDLNLIEER